MEKKINFTPWCGTDASTEVSLFEYGFIMRRKCGTHDWQVMHLVTERGIVEDDNPRYELDWFSPDDYIKDAEDENVWFRPKKMINFLGYDTVEDMIEAWKQSAVRCFDDLQSYHGMINILGGGYHYKFYTEPEVRKRLGRALH